MEEFTTIVDCFEAQVERFRDRIAVKTKVNSMTYDSLNKLANLIARQILNCCPVSQETDVQTIAMVFEHDTAMIAGIIGILKAGKTYVALDPTYPVDRLSYMLGDSKAKLIITNDNNLKLAYELSRQADYPVHILNLNSLDVNGVCNNLNLQITSEQAAYILYTSGSTGRPKGVIQSHQNILYFAHCFVKNLEITFEDRMALLTSYSHTMAAIDIFSVLLSGAALCPYDIKSEGNMGKLANWIKEEEITIYHSVPTVYRYFIETITGREQVSSIRTIVVGGETVYKNDIELYKKYFSEACLFVNLFGSSELIIAMINVISKEKPFINNSVPIGFLVKGVDALLLDENGDEVGTNGIGELVYRSRYLTPGYWKRDGLIQDIFPKDTLDSEIRIYHSGDLGKILPDGSIDYIGRKDFQVKISGNRVEMGEIEAKLLNHPSVTEAAIIAKQNLKGNNYLCAFFVSDRELSSAELREYLKMDLPDYMVPSYFLRLVKMPLTENGKLDRKELDRIKISINNLKEEDQPEDETEAMMVEVWKEILDLDQVGVNKSFFDMGGNSILAIKFEVEMEKRGLKLNSNDVYQFKTIRKLALYIKNPGEAIQCSRDTDTKCEKYCTGQERK